MKRPDFMDAQLIRTVPFATQNRLEESGISGVCIVRFSCPGYNGLVARASPRGGNREHEAEEFMVSFNQEIWLGDPRERGETMIKIRGMRIAAIAGMLLLAAMVSASRTRPMAMGQNERPQAGGGFVFTMTNQTAGNTVYAYARNTNGTLKFLDSFPTMGTGSGADLNSQGALLFLPNDKVLFVCNPASQTITSFTMGSGTLTFAGTTSVIPGRFPKSLTSLNNVLYVLNQGTKGGPTISGFTMGAKGSLTPIAGAEGKLSSGSATEPVQVGFTPSGTQIVTTQQMINTIDVFAVNANGTVGEAVATTSNDPGPFGFTFDQNGNLDSTEGTRDTNGGTNGLSSYAIQSGGSLTVLSGSVQDNGKEASHIVDTYITGLGEVAYVSNASSNTISSYSIDSTNGTVSLINEAAASLGTLVKAIDMATDSSGNYLYILTQKNGTITGFTINSDASLTQITTVTGLPTTATWGLAAD
jgi:6-phosphogluconolactonase